LAIAHPGPLRAAASTRRAPILTRFDLHSPRCQGNPPQPGTQIGESSGSSCGAPRLPVRSGA
jgi:hypothetical protein